MNVSAIIPGILLLSSGIAMVAHIFILTRKLRRTNARIRTSRYYIRIGEVAAEHVSKEHLAEADKSAELAIRKGMGLNNFGNDVRPMLDYVTMATGQIIDDKLSGEERYEISLSVSRVVKKLSDVVENVLMMARIDSDRIHCANKNLRVSDLIRDIYEEYNTQDGTQFSTKEGNGCKLGIIEGRHSLFISADQVYLKRALVEVIKNAFTFSRKGDILIGWFYRLGTDEVEIFVEDNGIGIAKENLNRVFDVFYKENPASNGLGIGLTIAKELIGKMGGRVIMVSRPGFGTRVSVLFPLQDDEENRGLKP